MAPSTSSSMRLAATYSGSGLTAPLLRGFHHLFDERFGFLWPASGACHQVCGDLA